MFSSIFFFRLFPFGHTPVAGDVNDLSQELLVAEFAEQYLAKVRFRRNGFEYLKQEFIGPSAVQGFLNEPVDRVEQLILDLEEQSIGVGVMRIEGAAVYVRQLADLRDGDLVDRAVFS